ncbi:M24 family metallopeptidase [Bacteriovorax sp. Seq25_V]|uniref:M24 family metallopeptidase n=1 Tax=Bacteriovorax sp. Seq25_V TaxID=1201288 RepID=UPI000389EA8A|nr:M24 family metallopeptidase [Bacteriovorax sp. Seq25_V]EQC47457.1 metallopeptidase family M24 [Bacteriovorax sp. Seq25_V]
MTQKILEANSSKFSNTILQKSRIQTIQIVKDFAKNLPLGITENEAKTRLEGVFNKAGSTKFWHPTKFRIGINTNKSFRDTSDEGITLQEDDVFFIDIGPILDGHEADYGETFCNGEKFNFLANASKEVFNKTAKIWKEETITGAQLYDKASQIAKEMGYTLNTKMAGHRIGDFPHHIHYRGSLDEVDFHPIENTWILEIHLIHDETGYGTFFEDILIGD